MNAIYITSDRKFLHYTIALINSIFENYSKHPKIILHLHSNVNLVENEFLLHIPSLEIIQDVNPLSEKTFQKKVTRKFNSIEFLETKYASFKLWSEEYRDYNRILFLDADMLVLKPLGELFKKSTFFIVDALNQKTTRILNSGSRKSQLLGVRKRKLLLDGIRLNNPSANSGVFLLPPQCRNNKEYQQLLQLNKRYKNFAWSDQSIVNLWMLKNNIEPSLDFRFNFQARFNELLRNGNDSVAILNDNLRESIEEAKKDIHILHFNGPKPDHDDFVGHEWIGNNKNLVEMFNYYANNGKVRFCK